MRSALKKVRFALAETVLVALHGIASAAIGWFFAKVVILAVKLGVFFIKISGATGPYSWAWIDVSDLWTYIPATIAGVLGVFLPVKAIANQEGDYFDFAPRVSLMVLVGTGFGGLAALFGGLVGAAIGIVIRICLWIFQIPIGPPADDLIHTIPGVAIGAIAFLVCFVLGAKAAEDSSWSELFSSSGGGYSGGGGGGGSYGGSSYSSPSPSPSYTSPPVDSYPQTPISSGPVYTPPPPPPDWTIALREQEAKDLAQRQAWEHHKNMWGS